MTTPRIGHNGGPPLDRSRTLDEAQADPNVQARPSYLQRYAGKDAPLRAIVAVGQLGALGRWVLLGCGHWKEIRDYDLLPLRRKERPRSARCGCCRTNILPDPADLEAARAYESGMIEADRSLLL